jgi:hypothetical protein
LEELEAERCADSKGMTLLALALSIALFTRALSVYYAERPRERGNFMIDFAWAASS